MIAFRLLCAAVIMALLPLAAVVMLRALGVPVGGDARHWYVGFVVALVVLESRRGRL